MSDPTLLYSSIHCVIPTIPNKENVIEDKCILSMGPYTYGLTVDLFQHIVLSCLCISHLTEVTLRSRRFNKHHGGERIYSMHVFVFECALLEKRFQFDLELEKGSSGSQVK